MAQAQCCQGSRLGCSGGMGVLPWDGETPASSPLLLPHLRDCQQTILLLMLEFQCLCIVQAELGDWLVSVPTVKAHGVCITEAAAGEAPDLVSPGGYIMSIPQAVVALEEWEGVGCYYIGCTTKGHMLGKGVLKFQPRSHGWSLGAIWLDDQRSENSSLG